MWFGLIIFLIFFLLLTIRKIKVSKNPKRNITLLLNSLIFDKTCINTLNIICESIPESHTILNNIAENEQRTSKSNSQKRKTGKKKEYYSKLSDRFGHLYYDPNRLGQESKLFIILNFDITDKLSAKIYKDSKLSALRNGMLRTFDTIDHMSIPKERKTDIIYDLVDIYYSIYHIFFIHQSMDTGCFLILAFINNAAINTGVHVSF